jgi:hypothetical protein
MSYVDRLRQIAIEEGVDPEVALAVVRSEGGFSDPYQRSLAPGEYSLGPLQLNMRRGVGANALAAGIDASKDWEAAYRYGLQHAKKTGWLGDWMGARKIGLENWAGLKGSGGAPALRHVGGAGSGEKYFNKPGAGYTQEPVPGGGGGQYTLPKEDGKKTPRDKFADAIKGLGGDLAENVGMGQAPSIIAPQLFGGEAVPSVMRAPFQPVQAPMPAQGGPDLRVLLAQLMGGQRG